MKTCQLKLVLFLIVVAANLLQTTTGSQTKKWQQQQSQSLNEEAKQSQDHQIKELTNKPSISATNPIDKAALEEFYHFTAGPAWLQNAGWLSGDPCQSMWYGIRCTPSGDVVEITLSHNSLAGELPDKLSEMKSLQILRLYDNAIGGIVPLSLFTMQSLSILDLDNNLLYGNLPVDLSMMSLTNLSIANNQIQGFLPYKWNCPNLESISLSTNAIQGPLPAGMSTLSKLKYLDLSSNYIIGPFPSEIGRSLSSLETFLFLGNKADVKIYIPESFKGFVKMKEFQAEFLNGELPEFIGSWSNLEILMLGIGQLTGTIPSSFCTLPKLQTLTIKYNMISGTIPKCICDLPATTLTSIDLSDNHLSGKLPNCFGNLRSLNHLDLSSNNFSGSIPDSLGSCVNLNYIALSENRFAGTVPYTFAQLNNTVNALYLYGNKLHTVDDGLETFFRGITYCSMYDNPWSCPLPDYFSSIRCGTSCSKCNSMDKHTSCRVCVGASECGWCTEGPNCLEGSIGGPTYDYQCEASNWIYGIEAECD